jgi:hypothetical protein
MEFFYRVFYGDFPITLLSERFPQAFRRLLTYQKAVASLRRLPYIKSNLTKFFIAERQPCLPAR